MAVAVGLGSAVGMGRRARRRLLGLGVAAFAVVGAWPATAGAFVCSRTAGQAGPSINWDTRSLSFIVNEKGSKDVPTADALAAVRASLKTWQDVPCTDITYQDLGTTPRTDAAYDDKRLRFGDTGYDPNARDPVDPSRARDNVNLIVWREASWPYDASVIAVTTTTFNSTTGIIFDADMELNGQKFRFAVVGVGCIPQGGPADIQNTVTHEAGHMIGLDHPPSTREFEDVTMFASAPPCETKKRSLEQDDINGVCSIYPKGQPTKPCVPPSGPKFLVKSEDDGFGCQAALVPDHLRPGGPVLWVGLSIVVLLAGRLVLRRPSPRTRRS